MRNALAIPWLVAAVMVATAALAQPAPRAPKDKGKAPKSEPAPEPPPPPPPPPPKPVRQRWIVHGVEVATTKKAAFRGTVVLRLTGAEKAQLLSYHWGGQCKDTALERSHFDLLLTALREQWTVEIPAYPIKYADRVYMCMQGLRVLRDE
jgi:hypothetical protein